ncbi:MAG TPA: hypothetical protein VE967_07660 [Gemmatimonadaceae bacterium]|nr:hypothetical protein [Gemmatimonadaceae bacterium]
MHFAFSRRALFQRAAIATFSCAMFAACAGSGASAGRATSGAQQVAPQAVWPAPIDPQVIRDQDDMTYDDYTPIPGVDWTHRDSKGTVKTLHLAVVTADFPDQPFVMTLPQKSDMYGNPQAAPVRREDIPKFFYDFYMVPNALNHGHTIYDYWLEQSHGRVGVVTRTFGPYRMPGKSFQYGINSPADLPGGYAQRNLGRDLDSLIKADPDTSVRAVLDTLQYKPVVRAFAGYDETATWQEFGEMKFQTTADIPKEWGNPDASKPRAVRSRYGAMVPWEAAKWPWSNAGGGVVTQGESINSIRHELGHAAFLIGDNYNNPFATPYRRAPVGPWDLMDRGSFNGPGGPHSRWKVPANAGGAMAAGLVLRQRMQFKFIDSSQVLMLERKSLAASGLAVAHVMTRVVDPEPGAVNGVHIRLDSTKVPGSDTLRTDLSPRDDPGTNPLSSGVPTWSFYAVEVVQRIGYDSFEPDNGVLITKNKDHDRDGRQGASFGVNVGGPNSYAAYVWAIDAHPEDINVVDFTRPNGEKVMRSIADYRQLNDALFHAGTNSGSACEWEDTPNRLHFYIVDTRKTDKGILDYTIAVRSLDGSGPHTRGVALVAGAGSGDAVSFTLTNTGTAAPFTAKHATKDPLYFAYDVYRLNVSVAGSGWDAALQNALAAVRFGASQPVKVLLRKHAGAASSATVTLTATSESDPKKTVSVTYTVK